jgi:hypothetical protein
MERLRTILLVGLVSSVGACSGATPTGPGGSNAFSFDFATASQQWQAGFADYPSGAESFMELTADYRPLPSPLGPSKSALFISGSNHSDDLFMFYKGRVSGLRALATYAARFEVEIATDVPKGCGGVGGSPGESVFLKAGATTTEPITAWALVPGTAPNGQITLVNVDKGNQSTSGRNAVVLGTIENSVPCQSVNGQLIRRWELKTFHSDTNVYVQTSDRGDAWLIVGTDSGFEGTTSIYYTRVVAAFDPT